MIEFNDTAKKSLFSALFLSLDKNNLTRSGAQTYILVLIEKIQLSKFKKFSVHTRFLIRILF